MIQASVRIDVPTCDRKDHRKILESWEEWVDNSDMEIVFDLHLLEEGVTYKYLAYFEGGYSDERRFVCEYGNKAKEI